MTVPTWTVGQVLTAADVNSWFVPLFVKKTVNESVTSSTTLQNDDALFIAVAANALYVVDCYILFDGAATGDFKWNWTVPASATFNFTNLHQPSPASNTDASINNMTQAASASVTANGAGVILPQYHSGLLTVAGTAGNLQLQWAQNTSNGTATRVLAGSYLMAQRVG